MEKEYSVKLYDDSVVKFKLISKDVFDELLTHQGWVEYLYPLQFQCSLPFVKAYTNGSEYIALMKKNIKQNAVVCQEEMFFSLLKEPELVFFGERKYDPDSFHYMLMYNEDKVATLFNNHTKKQIEGFSTVEKYYELDDGRYAIVFNDGGAEVFMNFKDMEILESIIGC
ncbi:MAG: hypothetical protein IKQ13_14425 [Treponema sp.]|nr:hypothetical protein [Treponema sp.]